MQEGIAELTHLYHKYIGGVFGPGHVVVRSAIMKQLGNKGGPLLMCKRSHQVEFGDIWRDGKTPDEAHEYWGNHWMAWMYWVFALEDAARMIGEQAFHHEQREGKVVMRLYCQASRDSSLFGETKLR